jgi:GDP-4-dehydro-6-deoxy-D-mannose reductase
MKVLVTGATGFVGQHLVRELESLEYEVLGLGHENLNLMDAGEVNSINFKEISYVFHLAGLAAVGPSFENPKKYITSNSEIEINLFEACLSQNVKPGFLVVGSGSIYNPAKLPITESSPLKLSSPYSVSKLTQESIALYYKERGFPVIIARPFNHIGPGQGSGFIVPDLIGQFAAHNSNPVKIRAGNLDTSRDYTDVRDIVRAYVSLMKKGRAGEIYNICSGKATSGSEILEALAKLFNKEVAVEIDPSKIRPTETETIYGSNSKLKADTGWAPSISLEQTLKDAVAESLPSRSQS